MRRQSGRSIGMGICLLLAFAAGAPSASDVDGAQSPQIVYLVPGSHFDLGYTMPLSGLRELRIRILDEAIEAASRDPEFVWFEEAGWTAEVWLDHYHDDPARIARLRELVAKGRIAFGATMLSGHAAAFPEGLPLLTMHLERVERELGKRPDVAVVNDVPAVAASFRDALIKAGVTRLLMGPNSIFSPPIPATISRRPFRWTDAAGRYVDVFIDPDGVTAGVNVWGLPPNCARLFEPARFGLDSEDAEVFRRGVLEGVARITAARSSLLVQHAFDNWDTSCARELPRAVRQWNASTQAAQIELSQPSRYFQAAPAPPVRRGEWAMHWDVIRASEPLWTWRLREAMRAVSDTTPRSARMALVEAMDHNVGVGPRWQGNLSMAQGARHVKDAAARYRDAVRTMLGPGSEDSAPRPLSEPHSQPWPEAWRRVLGDPGDAVRVRAGNAAMEPMVNPSEGRWAAPLKVGADSERLVVRTRIDRVAAEKKLGQRYRIALEVGIRQPASRLSLGLVGSDDAVRFGWLDDRMPSAVVSPRGISVHGDQGLQLQAYGPLVLVWGLQADPIDPELTWLQALAVNNATHAEVGNQPILLPFEQLYEGEPAVLDFELELKLTAPVDLVDQDGGES